VPGQHLPAEGVARLVLVGGGEVREDVALDRGPREGQRRDAAEDPARQLLLVAVDQVLEAAADRDPLRGAGEERDVAAVGVLLRRAGVVDVRVLRADPDPEGLRDDRARGSDDVALLFEERLAVRPARAAPE
jgi:hypothetical protein